MPGREKEPSPIPYALSDEGQASTNQFRARVLETLRLTDVWGFIAAGTATNTQALIELLKPIDVPILVTTDSTVERGHNPGRVHHLRLIPNNERQAMAIAFSVLTLLGNGQDVPAGLFQYPPDDAYVRNLAEALRDAFGIAEIPVHNISEPSDTSELSEESPMVVVGYHDAAELLAKPLRQRTVILSDGCHDPKVQKLVQDKNLAAWRWTRPRIPIGVLGAHAYEALRTTGHHIVTRGTHLSVAQDRLRPSTLLITEQLERSYPPFYSFGGINNTRLTYVVETVPSN